MLVTRLKVFSKSVIPFLSHSVRALSKKVCSTVSSNRTVLSVCASRYFNNMDSACKEHRYRSIAKETELILNQLIHEISETGRFTIDLYLKLSFKYKPKS